MNPSDLAALIQVQTAKGVGPAKLSEILNSLHSAQISLPEFLQFDEDSAADIRLRDAWRAAHDHSESQPFFEIANDVLDKGWQVVTLFDDAYPHRLKRVLGEKAPTVLYVWGNHNILRAGSGGDKAIGFSGSRNVSPEGIAAARQLARMAAEREYTVVSGHAPGVDNAAHLAALEGDATTIFVIAEGVLSFRMRKELRELAIANKTSWVVVSQFSPLSKWTVPNAMTRNSTIIGLSDALFVIECGRDGGTWAAAQTATKLKHPLYVIDYPIEKPEIGNQDLLKAGFAKPIRVDNDGAHFPTIEARDPDEAPHQQKNLL